MVVLSASGFAPPVHVGFLYLKLPRVTFAMKPLEDRCYRCGVVRRLRRPSPHASTKPRKTVSRSPSPPKASSPSSTHFYMGTAADGLRSRSWRRLVVKQMAWKLERKTPGFDAPLTGCPGPKNRWMSWIALARRDRRARRPPTL